MKVTIIATDNIGRKESISLRINEWTVEKLEHAFNNTLPDGRSENTLRTTLNYMKEVSRYHESPFFSRFQLRKLNEFDRLIFHKFDKYELSLQLGAKNE